MSQLKGLDDSKGTHMPFFNKLINIVKVYVLITIGTAITALAINIFMVPYKIAPGGLSGLATVIYYLSGGRFTVGITMLVINVPLFVMGYKYIGKHFFIRTIYGTIVLSLIIDFSEPFTVNMASKFIKNFKIGGSNPDILLYSIIGGFMAGVGLGIVMKMDATTGGSELAARLLQRLFSLLTIGQLILIIDASIVLFAVITFNSILIGLYSLVSLFITIKVIDAIVEGVDFSRALLIISDHPKEISKMILEKLDRGVTEFKARGGYTGNEKDVLLCVIQRSQVQELKELVHGVDPKA
jgi:uncharacterized membrane-anchored protein YitT (DUF2179 family)